MLELMCFAALCDDIVTAYQALLGEGYTLQLRHHY